MPQSDLSIGIDVGATKIRSAVVDESGAILKSLDMRSWEYPDLQGNIGKLVDQVKSLLQLYGAERVRAIGMGLPGTVDDKRGMVVYTPNLRWRDVPIVKILREHTGLPVHLIQDTSAAVWGEYLYGAGVGHQNVVCTAVGSGIACGIIIKGELYGGTSHTAGEIGHIHMEDDGLPCGCGKLGCLEAYASGLGVVKLFRQELNHGAPKLSERYPVNEIDSHAIFDAAREGDAFCAAVIDKMVRYLARGLSAVATTLSPDIVIISGGLSKETQLLFSPLREYFYEYSYRSVRENVRMELALLGENAPLIGAAALHLAPEYQ